MLTARMDSSAMEAPGRMMFQIGQQTSQMADEVLQFGMEQIKIGAKAKAGEQVPNMERELAEAEVIATTGTDPSVGQKFYQDRAKLIRQKYANKVGSRYGRGIFNDAANKSIARGLARVTKRNNQRSLDIGYAGIRGKIREQRIILQDTSKTEAERLQAHSELLSLTRENFNIDPQKAATDNIKDITGIVSGHILTQIQKSDDPVTAARNFATNGVIDKVVKQYYDRVTPQERTKIFSDAVKYAEKLVKGEVRAEKDQAKADKEQLKDTFRKVLNPATPKAERERLHGFLLSANYYESKDFKALASANHTRSLEGVDNFITSPGAGSSEEKQQHLNNYAELLAHANADTLTAEKVEAFGVGGLGTHLTKAYRLLKTEFNDARRLANDNIKKASKYSEHSMIDSDFTKTARAEYNAESLALNDWITENPKASHAEIMAFNKTQVARINASMEEFARQSYQNEYEKITTSTLANFFRGQGAALKAQVNSNNIVTVLKKWRLSNPRIIERTVDQSLRIFSRYSQYGFGVEGQQGSGN